MALIPTTYKSIIVYLIIALSEAIPFYGYSQDMPSMSKERVTTKLSYEEIQDLEYDALEEEDSAALGMLIKIHLKKATLENNNLEKARAYYYKTTLAENLAALAYADSIILLTKDAKNGHSIPPWPD
ncbi:hypothetical protein [Salegentibacter flavus]|uniref:Uncharacterized protein n=1 Tax=Salegentibacter flavus TaxID=287099 RepID=A0A1I4YS88_9FLAO|nr:hypothetical protein [Salegentibacter flavus]SFN40837.1 hypothetical protein SAMN05660413_00905 [Salegentibacter flavus]